MDGDMEQATSMMMDSESICGRASVFQGARVPLGRKDEP
jgi:hypothetical protein